MPLPGDAESVLAYDLARAVRRDNRLTYAERWALSLTDSCLMAKRAFSWWECSYASPCVYCEELTT